MRTISDAVTKTGASFTNLAAGNNASIKYLQGLEKTMVKGSPLYNAIANYIKLLLQIPTVRNTTIDVNGRPLSAVAAAAYYSKTHPTAAGGYIDGSRASAAGGDFTMNEHGYEATQWIPGGGFRVTPHSGSMGGGGGVTDLHVHVSQPLGTPFAIAAAVVDAINTSAAQGNIHTLHVKTG